MSEADFELAVPVFEQPRFTNVLEMFILDLLEISEIFLESIPYGNISIRQLRGDFTIQQVADTGTQWCMRTDKEKYAQSVCKLAAKHNKNKSRS